jgi:hypothetical protein
MIQSLAKKYFKLLGDHFPVMTGSDEFYFFPRVQSLNWEVENFDPGLIAQVISEIKKIQKDLKRIKPADLDEKIDLRMIQLSMNNIIFHFEDMPVWRRDPCLYLKILIFALDPSRFPEAPQGRPKRPGRPGRKWIKSRLSSLLRLLEGARENLTQVPEIHRNLGLEMIKDVKVFLQSIRKEGLFKESAFDPLLSGIREAIDRLKEHLGNLTAIGEAAVGKELIERMLIENYGWPHSLSTARDQIEQEIAEAERTLRRQAKKIKPGKSPDYLIQRLPAPVLTHVSILAAYKREVKKIKQFLIEKDLFALPPDPGVEVEFTPLAMRSIRSAAAYVAPLSLRAGPGKYYILPIPGGPHTKVQKTRLAFIHRQIGFVTAHETYPGHHLLDLSRLSNKNPVRTRIELPLVYEGWACYAESIPVRAGYLTNPVEAMLAHKRRWWRALRGLADLSYQSGEASLDQAAQIIVRMGHDPEMAMRMVRRFALNPGYQMCYTLGTTGFFDLRREFAKSFSEREFHNRILEAGEIPLAEAGMRLKAVAGKK